MHVHHLTMLCRNRELAKNKLLRLYGFHEYGQFLSGSYFQDCILLKQNDIYIMLTEDLTNPVDTIHDIAFSIDSVESYCDVIGQNGGSIVQRPCSVDCSGHVINIQNKDKTCLCGTSQCTNFIDVAVVKSPLGNVRHTLLYTESYTGEFLPGYIRTNTIHPDVNSTLLRIDHIAFSVHQSTAMKYVNWYKSCFKLLPFKISSRETTNGLIVRTRGDNGLRLVTLVEHPCSDLALLPNQNNQEFELQNQHVKFVFGESLHNEGNDQIQTFIRNHREEGVQHIAFLSTKILHDTQLWIQNGVEFIKPPDGYYKEIKPTLQRLSSKINLDDVYNNCILIDAEKDNETDGYLYQVFTKSILESNTFFFELIQRDNARGFGQGNITALWRALDAHTQEELAKNQSDSI